jgi:hypothetical protein
MALKAAGESIPDWLINVVKSQAKSGSFDLDMRGWALAAASPWLSDAKKATIVNQLQLLEVNAGADAGMFKNPQLNYINSNTQGCVLSGIVGCGIDVQNALFKVGDITPLTVLRNTYMTSDGQFYYSSSYPFISFNKDVIIALGDVMHGGNVWARYTLTEEKYNSLLALADTYAVSTASMPAYGDTGYGEAYFSLYDAVAEYDSTLKADVQWGAPYQVFEDAVAALPEADALTADDLSDVKAAIDQYEALDDNSKDTVDQDIMQKYYDLGAAALTLKADQDEIADSKAADIYVRILALPDALVVTESSSSEVSAIRSIYDKIDRKSVV